jgi:hypothetical protein
MMLGAQASPAPRTWTIPCGRGMRVQAAQLHHRVPCWGYAVQEAPLPPAVRADAARKLGVSPDAVLAALSREGMQADLTLPDGSKARFLESSYNEIGHVGLCCVPA